MIKKWQRMVLKLFLKLKILKKRLFIKLTVLFQKNCPRSIQIKKEINFKSYFNTIKLTK